MHLHPYIDIHKHENAMQQDKDVLAIYNKYEAFQLLAPGEQYSLGIHPWYIQDADKQFDALKTAVHQSNVVAIGECGIDAMRGASPELQEKVFHRQIHLANECNKPLVVHCVRAFPQTLSLLRQAKVPVVFHGFNKKRAIAGDILKQGYYLSFGADLWKEDSAAYTVFSTIPDNRFFFETDDKAIDIKEIYKAGSRIRKADEDAVILQVQENFKNVFGL